MVKTLGESSGSTCIIAGNLQWWKKSNKIIYIHQNQPLKKMFKKVWFDGQTSHFNIDEVGFCKIEGEDQATTGK